MTDIATKHAETDELEARIDIPVVTEALLGTWADIRREAREMIKDSAFWRIEGQAIPEHRERTLSQLHLLVKAGANSRANRRNTAGRRTRAAISPDSRSSSPPTRACRSSRACSGGCSARRSCSSAPSRTTTSGCATPLT